MIVIDEGAVNLKTFPISSNMRTELLSIEFLSVAILSEIPTFLNKEKIIIKEKYNGDERFYI